jgi:hypothetical protein
MPVVQKRWEVVQSGKDWIVQSSGGQAWSGTSWILIWWVSWTGPRNLEDIETCSWTFSQEYFNEENMPLVVLESEQNDRKYSHHGRMNGLKYERRSRPGTFSGTKSFVNWSKFTSPRIKFWWLLRKIAAGQRRYIGGNVAERGTRHLAWISQKKGRSFQFHRPDYCPMRKYIWPQSIIRFTRPDSRIGEGADRPPKIRQFSAKRFAIFSYFMFENVNLWQSRLVKASFLFGCWRCTRFRDRLFQSLARRGNLWPSQSVHAISRRYNITPFAGA